MTVHILTPQNIIEREAISDKKKNKDEDNNFQYRGKTN